MIFNSLTFVVFFTTFLSLYFMTRGRVRLLLIVLGSLVFYGWWDWRFCFLLIGCTVGDFIFAIGIADSLRTSTRRVWLSCSIAMNMGALCIFKYFDFFSRSFADLAGMIGWRVDPFLLHVVLPVGISFYVFQTLSYTIDVYRNKIKEERDLLTFAAFVTLFPQLEAGPIVRAYQLIPQLKFDHEFDLQRIGRSIELIIWGLFLKMCLADTASTVADPRFLEPIMYNSLGHVIGVFCFAFQIYGDFAGYSLIAIGLALMLGYEFPRNFNRPYFSTNFSHFWERWHISLSSWIRDYIYIPLGGGRLGRRRTFANLAITMILAGLWHGAAWTFVVWGMLHAIYLMLQRAISPLYGRLVLALRVPLLISNLLAICVVFLATCVGWVFFRASSFSDAYFILRTIFFAADFSFVPGQQTVAIFKSFLMIAFVVFVDAVSSVESVRTAYFSNVALRVVGMAIIALLILAFGAFSGASFIYFQF